MKKYGFYDDSHHVSRNIDKNSFSSTDEATEFLLKSLNSCLTNSIIDDKKLLLPDYNITIFPRVAEMSEKIITSEYFLNSPDWDDTVYECSTGVAANQKDALGMSQASFLFGIMNAISSMMNNENPRELHTEFAEHSHSWKVYIGDIVGMGKYDEETNVDIYWNTLQSEIAKRIGNQKLCYIKIYGANDGNGNITGECRINDVKSDELSDIISDMVSKWNNTEFYSQKQFFMIKQDKETYIEQPFTVSEIMAKTELAMKLFESCETDEEYNKFPDMLLTAAGGDSSLAWELYSFIPEICAQNAFDKINYPETVMMDIRGESHEYYLTQLYSYYPILNGVFRGLNRGILKDTNKTYNEYISVSSVFNVICSAKEQGKDLETDVGQMCIMYRPDDDYIVR